MPERFSRLLTSELPALLLPVLAWCGLTLAELGWFHSLVAVAVSLPLFWLILRFPSESRPRIPWLCIGITALAMLWSFPRSEMLLGGWDPGVYVHTAAALEEQGTLQFSLTGLENLTPKEIQVLSHDLWGQPEIYPGMRMMPDGRVSPQFFHLYPALMAIAFSFGGLTAAWGLNGLLYGACLLAFAGLLRRLFGPPWDAVGLFLLAVHPAQVWMSAFPTAELFAQYLLISGTSRILELQNPDSGIRPALLAGVFFGLSLLCRVDSLLYLLPLSLGLMIFWSFHPGDRRIAAFFGVLGIFFLQSILHLTFVAPYYLPLSNLLLPLLGATLVFMPILKAVPRRIPEPILRRFAFWLVPAVFCVWCLGLLGLGYIRPRLGMDGTVNSLWEGIGLPMPPDWMMGGNVRNLQRLTALFHPVPFLIACCGVPLLFLRSRDLLHRICWGAGVGVTLLLITNSFHDSFLMWVSRRYIPVVIPFLILGICEVGRRCSRRFLPVGISLCVVCGGLMIPASWHQIRNRDWPGLEPWFAQLTEKLPDQAVLFSDQPGFAAPLRFVYGVESYEIKIEEGEEALNLPVVMRRNAELKPVFLLTQDPEKEYKGLETEEQSLLPLRTWILEQPRVTLPNARKNRSADLYLLKLSPREEDV